MCKPHICDADAMELQWMRTCPCGVLQEWVAVRRGEKVWFLRLPHGGGKHGCHTTEADKGRRNAMAVRLLRTQHAGTGLRRCSQSHTAQTS